MFKVGDRVKRTTGQLGTVVNVDYNGDPRVRYDDGSTTWVFARDFKKIETNADRFPKAYNRLLTMPGVTEEERRMCIDDFLQMQHDCEEVNLLDVDCLRSMFYWPKSGNGYKFWRDINCNVYDAERKQKEQEEKRIKSELDAELFKRGVQCRFTDIIPREMASMVDQNKYLYQSLIGHEIGFPPTSLIKKRGPIKYNGIPISEWMKHDRFHTNELGLRVRPFVRSDEEPRNEWPTQKDIDECCGVWNPNFSSDYEYDTAYDKVRELGIDWGDEFETTHEFIESIEQHIVNLDPRYESSTISKAKDAISILSDLPGDGIVSIKPSDLVEYQSRVHFNRVFEDYERIEPMPQDKPKQRDADTLRALKNYPSNRDTDMEWTDRRVR